jgi:flagellar basal body-associated protein FliL
MSDKPEKKPDAAAPAASAAPAGDKPAEKAKGGFLTKTPVLLGGVMVIEAVVLFAGFKILGSKPQAAPGAEMSTTEGDKDGKGKAGDKKTTEIQVVDFKALNRANGRSILYSISIFVVTKADHEDTVKDKFKDNKALIEDRVRTIIAESDPEKLDGASEPGLETLRRQVKYQLDGILGDGVIDEVLVPQCIPFRTE